MTLIPQIFRRLTLLLLALSLAACARQELHGAVSESQVNDMMALLQTHGIEAQKEPRDAGTYALTVQQENFSRAHSLLKAHGLPRGAFETLCQVFKKEGFVSSPVEERARLNCALSQELANTLQSIDGVVLARVHLAVPEKDPLSDKAKPASASVLIKHRAGKDLNSQIGLMKALVVNGVEGVPYDNVTVALSPADPAPLAPVLPAPSAALSLPLSIAAAVGLVMLMFGALMWWMRRRSLPTGTGLMLVQAQGAERA